MAERRFLSIMVVPEDGRESHTFRVSYRMLKVAATFGFILAFVTRWLVDAILLQVIAWLTRSLEIESFGTAFLAAMVMSGLGTVAELLLRSA